MSEKIFDDVLATFVGSNASPIESKLYMHLLEFFKKEEVERQRAIGKYRVDFFIPPRFVIEADGKDFHDAQVDGIRDADPCFSGVITIRCSGTLIHRYPRMVARRIKQIVGFYVSGNVRGNCRVWRLYQPYQIPEIGEKI